MHGIMRNHNGAITVDSTLGDGTIVRLYLRAAAQGMASEPMPPVPGRGHRILFVDDEEALVFLPTRALGKLGYRVDGHTDSVKALRAFRSRPGNFDIVIADVGMPGLDGAELAAELLAIYNCGGAWRGYSKRPLGARGSFPRRVRPTEVGSWLQPAEDLMVRHVPKPPGARLARTCKARATS